MYSLNRSGSRRSTNIWPAFVDGLSTLLLVIIFVLMVFVIAQYYLSVALSGRDERLARLDQQIAELSELLALERGVTSELRSTLDGLTREFQASVEVRDALVQELARLEAERDSLEGQLGALRATQAQTEGELAAIIESREGLRLRLMEAERRGDDLNEALAEASATIQADRETIEVQLAEIALLRDLREELDRQVADRERDLRATEALLEESRAALNELEQKLAQQEVLIARQSEELQKREEALSTSQATIAQQAEELEAQAQEIQLSRTTLQRLEELLAAREASLAEQQATLSARVEELRLSEETLERVREELARRDQRIEELESQLAALGDREQAQLNELAALRRARDSLRQRLQEQGSRLAEQEQLSSEAQRRVDLLNRQIAALRRQLAALQVALEASEEREREQEVQIADLGRRLNMALASRVQELARYRSEFFGRLREILGDDNPAIEIVGDRFVFQAEVLFPSGSDRLQPEGCEQIRQLAVLLRDIAERIPDDIDWVLRVDGHTDRRPIATPLFPSNWELSSARAISVVRLLLEEGIPANRLVAAGFGEHQPLDPRPLPEAYDRNRRIELKLTER